MSNEHELSDVEQGVAAQCRRAKAAARRLGICPAG